MSIHLIDMCVCVCVYVCVCKKREIYYKVLAYAVMMTEKAQYL